MPFPPTSGFVMPPYNYASPTRCRAGVPASINSLTPQPENAVIQHPRNSWHGEADIGAHCGGTTAGGSGDQPSGISNLTGFSSTATSHQRTITDHILENPENFDDAPYIPPRVTQAELQGYPALDPRVGSTDIPHQYPYDGGTSPAESHQSLESHWSTSSSSSTSSQQLPGDYLTEPNTQHPQHPPSIHHTYPQYYPAYHGHQRIGLEHVRHGEQPSNTGRSYYRTSPQSYPMDSLLSSDTVSGAGAGINFSSQMNYPAASSQGPSSSAIFATSQPIDVSTFPVSSTSAIHTSRSSFLDAGPYLRQQLGLSANEPVNLLSLPDPPPGEKPPTPLPMLIKLAIYGSPNKQLTLQEIYTALENRFEWFREHRNDKAWKNSIRHNLSLNQVFQHVARPITSPGKGSYWQLDISKGEGYKRPRKRRTKNKIIVSEEEEEVSEMDEDNPSTADQPGPSRSSSTPVEDANIDPGLRGEGHVVGEGRTRSTTRRAGGGPYSSQSPRYQQASLPVVAGQEASVLGQPPIRFGQSSFPTYPQTRVMSVPSTSAPFSTLSSSSVSMASVPSTATHLQVQPMTSHDRDAHTPQPPSTPRPGIKYGMEQGGIPAVLRMQSYAEVQAQSPDDAECLSPVME